MHNTIRKQNPIRPLMVIAAAGGILAVAGCGGTSYGNGGLKDKSGGKASIGDPSPSPSAAPAAVVPPPVTQTQPTTTTVAPPPTHAPTPPPPTRQAQKFAIGIYGDSSGQPQYSPPAAKVYTGTIITFTNHDSAPRSVVSDNGSFNSGPIPPGGTWSYTASTPGTFNYHDGTRPYAVAQFQVVNP